jgi:hypothetical protein
VGRRSAAYPELMGAGARMAELQAGGYLTS